MPNTNESINGARDPRIDPRHGDAVRVRSETREVETVTNGKVIYSWPGKLAVRTLSLAGWQQWAKAGDVVELTPTEAA